MAMYDSFGRELSIRIVSAYVLLLLLLYRFFGI